MGGYCFPTLIEDSDRTWIVMMVQFRNDFMLYCIYIYNIIYILLYIYYGIIIAKCRAIKFLRGRHVPENTASCFRANFFRRIPLKR